MAGTQEWHQESGVLSIAMDKGYLLSSLLNFTLGFANLHFECSL